MKRLCLLAVATLMALSEACAAEWQRLSARLMTPWGETIDPENVWQEYPRPQLVRDNWMNLNGVWDYFRRTNSVKLTYEETASRFTQKILVPFGVESALSGIMHTDYSTTANSTLMYRRTFTLPENFQGKRILLHFGAVDWQCAVFVNGTQVGEHKGGSDPFTFDITNFLLASGEQELQVAVYDPSSRGGQPNGKQTVSPSGIWQTVWLEAVGKQYVQRYELVPDAETGSVRVRARQLADREKQNLARRYRRHVDAERLVVQKRVDLREKAARGNDAQDRAVPPEIAALNGDAAGEHQPHAPGDVARAQDRFAPAVSAPAGPQQPCRLRGLIVRQAAEQRAFAQRFDFRHRNPSVFAELWQ